MSNFKEIDVKKVRKKKKGSSVLSDDNQNKSSEKESHTCFLCPQSASQQCEYCQLVHFCSDEHKELHRMGSYCFPYKVGYMKEKGRVLFATRDIKALDLIMVDPGAIVGPNYRSNTVCIQCLKLVELDANRCPACGFPLCGARCSEGARHQSQCAILARETERARLIGTPEGLSSYAHVSVLRILQLEEEGGDAWERTNHLMDHLTEREVHPEEWKWYTSEITTYLRNELKLADRFKVEQIERAIGLLNVNAVCLQFPRIRGHPSCEVGKGIYPIFAIMSHECICNARYIVDPDTFKMYVRARRNIKAGEELTVQYLSALTGNLKRRKRIKEEWFFDCCCKRCSDRTECGTYISGVKCFDCKSGVLLADNPLDYVSFWSCTQCKSTVTHQRIEEVIDLAQSEFDSILDTEEFWRYQLFIEKYSGTILHENHWIITTARRNLIQYMCYSSPTDWKPDMTLQEKVKLCQDFWTVLNKVDPGWSELSMFAQRELLFNKLAQLQENYARGLIPMDEFSVKSRNSIEAFDLVMKRGKQFLDFKEDQDASPC